MFSKYIMTANTTTISFEIKKKLKERSPHNSFTENQKQAYCIQNCKISYLEICKPLTSPLFF